MSSGSGILINVNVYCEIMKCNKHQQQITNGIRKITPPPPSPENCPPDIIPQKIAPVKIRPHEYSPLLKLLPVKITPQKFAPEKISPVKITSNEIPFPPINHANERKKKMQIFLP